MVGFDSVLAFVLLAPLAAHAQPSPTVQERISAAIKAAANASHVDYTAFVNPFIGTDNFGDVCPGASVPFGMAKFSTHFTGYAPAGYVVDPSQKIRGISPLHDSGTGSSLGSYGNFEIMPLLCPGGFDTCTTTLQARERLRKNNTDDASPGYFSQTLNNDIQIEATSTRRAGLERFTFPGGSKPYFVLDLSNDLPASFGGGSMDIDPVKGRITLGGQWKPSFGPGLFFYQAFACYDLLNNGKQRLDEYGVWTGNTFGLDAKGLGQTHLNLSINLIGGQLTQSGALFSYADDPTEVTVRVGVSFQSTEKACQNAEMEVGTSSFEEIRDLSKALWQEKLRKIEIDVPNTPPNVTELIYSSLYRASLTPNNATDEGQGVFANTTSPYFDSLYCSWDTFRTFYPLMALHSPEEFAQIVKTYIDGWKKTGWMPECRSNNLPGWTQGGSDGDNIVSHFAMNYHNEAARLGVDLDELYAALKTDGEVNPPEWNIHGRQVNVYKQYGYVPFGVLDPSSTGRTTREGSRTLEYAFNDFGIRQVAQLLGKPGDVEAYTNRSLFYRNIWDANVKSDVFQGFMQKRRPNGTFVYIDPIDCSPNDKNDSRPCSLTEDNINGFYESSAWEYSFFVPHDTAHLIELMGGNVGGNLEDFHWAGLTFVTFLQETFVKRLDHFFSADYFLAGNEPSFQTPIGYHYANHPTKTNIGGFSNYNLYCTISTCGFTGQRRPGCHGHFVDVPSPRTLPKYDFDMGVVLPALNIRISVPSSSQLLILSPFTPKYTIHNSFLNVSTTVTVKNFDPKSVQKKIPVGTSAYVKGVTVNGKPTESRCHFDFYDTFRLGGEIVIELTADKASVDDCGGSLPESVSTGGFAAAR